MSDGSGPIIYPRFEAHFLGIIERAGSEPCAVYDAQGIVEQLTEEMPEGEAEEFFEWNLANADLGPNGPWFLWRDEGGDDEL